MTDLTKLGQLQKAVEEATSVAVSAYVVAHANYYASPYDAHASDATDVLMKARLDLNNYLKEQDND